jgi:hypothetical protein
MNELDEDSQPLAEIKNYVQNVCEDNTSRDQQGVVMHVYTRGEFHSKWFVDSS